MNIRDQFRVTAPVDEAWKVMLDIERIAPCMPGAQLQEVEGDEYRGIVKVKVGPITAQYKGAARVVEADEAARRIVMKAEGRDTRGQGNASATITATMAPVDGGTEISIDTDLNVTGKVAQFGRGVMADVSSKLLGQFASCLEADVLAGATGAEAQNPVDARVDAQVDTSEAAAAGVPVGDPIPPEAVADAVRSIDSPEAQPIDLMSAAGGAVAKRLVPAVLVAGIVVALVIWLLTK